MSASGAIKLLVLTAATATTASTDAGQPLVSTTNLGDWDIPTGATGAYFVLNLSASSGTTGAQLVIEGKDEISGSYYQINATPTAVKASGVTVYLVYPSGGAAPGSGSGITQLTSNAPIPPRGRVRFVVTDGTHTGTCSMTPILDA